MSDYLSNYRQLRTRVEELCQRIEREQAQHLVCRRGCDSCCRHLRLFPVEAAALAEALRALPPQQQVALRARATAASPDSPCPLLADGACLLYEARPIICRTHGLPLLLATPDGRRVDYCPMNFTGVTNLPAAAVIELERLNEVLAAINLLYLRETGQTIQSEDGRVGIAEVLLTVCTDTRTDSLLL